jgi:hypothetical protein
VDISSVPEDISNGKNHILEDETKETSEGMISQVISLVLIVLIMQRGLRIISNISLGLGFPVNEDPCDVDTQYRILKKRFLRLYILLR